MDTLAWIALCAAMLLSYQMPVYAARLIGQEQTLAHLWNAVLQDSPAAHVLFFAAYMIAGFVLWAGPVGYVAAHFHPGSGPAMRRRTGVFLSYLLFPLRPLLHLIERKYDDWNGDMIERRTMKALYKRDFSQQFPAFKQFYRYYKWLNDRHYIDPVQPLTAFSDPFQDAEALLGLTGNYGAQDLSARYRALIKQVHPDIAPPSDIARRLTEARDIIKARKGWK